VSVLAGDAATLRTDSGAMAIELWRGVCPPDARPCGEDCPFAEATLVDRVVLGARAPALRRLAERAYCVGLTTGEVAFRVGGSEGSLRFEVVASEPGGETGLAPRLSALCLSTGGHEQVVPVAAFAEPLLTRARNLDIYATGRMGPSYWAYSTWEEVPAARRARRVTPGRWMLGADVLPGDFAKLAARASDFELAQPAGEASAAPLVSVFWRDSDGLTRAASAAAANPERETAFVLEGSMHFCESTRTPYTCVQEVCEVEDYEARDSARASISPSGMRDARAHALARGLQVVGILHSHVLDTEAASEHAHSVFYSGADADDHANFLPPAWSVGGVLDVRADGCVDLALFAQDAEGGFSALPRMLLLEPSGLQPKPSGPIGQGRNEDVTT
jgi:hypothetical protein